MELIEEIILKNYTHFHEQLTEVTLSDPIYHSLLTGIAMGDRRTHSAFKRARISEETGNPALRYLCQNDLIERESPVLQPSGKEEVDDKLNFSTPFLRFWFAFISPLFKGIQAGDYSEVAERFENRKEGFSDLVFEKLSIELLKKSFENDPIVEVGSYWDKELEIDILAKTASGKVIAGECKYANAKLKKSTLSNLKERCGKLGLDPDIFILFSKRGFSSELRSLKGENLRLFSAKNFKKLIED